MKVYIKHFFLPQFRIIGGILLLVSPIIYLEVHFLASLISMVLGGTLVFMTLEFEVNDVGKFYKKGPSLFRLVNFGDKMPFESVQYAYIKKGQESLKLNSRTSSTTIQKDIYYAFLKFSDTHKVMFYKSENKDKLESRISRILTYLHTELRE